MVGASEKGFATVVIAGLKVGASVFGEGVHFLPVPRDTVEGVELVPLPDASALKMAALPLTESFEARQVLLL